jgi:uncharacterized protein (DUF983 family)
MATTATGIQLCCPHCLETEANVRLHLADGTLVCEECDQKVTEQEVEEAIAALSKWRRVFAWSKQMPTE